MSFTSSLSLMTISFQVSLRVKKHMLFRSLKNPKSNRVGTEAEDVVWNEIGDGVGTGIGYGAGDGTPSGSKPRGTINF